MGDVSISFTILIASLNKGKNNFEKVHREGRGKQLKIRGVNTLKK